MKRYFYTIIGFLAIACAALAVHPQPAGEGEGGSGTEWTNYESYAMWQSSCEGQNNGHSQKTYYLNVPDIPTRLYFEWKVSSEEGYDIFYVVLDGILVLQDSGEKQDVFTQSLTPGLHTLELHYLKDGSDNDGQDMAKVSHIYLQSDDPAALEKIKYDEMKNNLEEMVTIVHYYRPYLTDNELINACIEGRKLLHDGQEHSYDELQAAYITLMTAVQNDMAEINEYQTVAMEAMQLASQLNEELQGMEPYLPYIHNEGYLAAYNKLKNMLEGDESYTLEQWQAQQASYKMALDAAAEDIAVIKVMDIDLSKIDWNYDYKLIGDAYYLLDDENGVAAFAYCAETVKQPTYTIPMTVDCDGRTYYVVSMYTHSVPYYLSEQPFIRSLELPFSMRQINGYALSVFNGLYDLTVPANLEELPASPVTHTLRLHFTTPTPPSMTFTPGYGKYYDITVPDGSVIAYRQWLSTMNVECVLHDGYGWQDNVEHFTLILPSANSLYDEWVSSLSNVNIDNVHALTLYGPLGEQDFNVIRQFEYLVRLDLSNASIKSLPAGALSDMKFLSEVRLPSTVQSIGDNAFRNCIALHNVPQSQYTSIGASAFINCPIEDIQLPSTVQSIGSYAFSGTHASTLALPEGVSKVEMSAFQYCKTLSEVTLPATMKQIPAFMFQNCSNLQRVTLPAMLQKIGEYAFAGCGIRQLDIPASMRSIGENAFRENYSMEQLTLHEGLNSIGRYAFQNCDSLTALHLPNSLTYLGENSFSDIDALQKVHVGTGIEELAQGTFQNCTRLSEVELSEGLQTLGSYCIYNTAVTQLDLPASVCDVSYDIKGPYGELESLTCRSPFPPSLDGEFTTGLLLVPAIGYEAYVIDEHWGQNVDIRPFDSWPKQLTINTPVVLNNLKAPADYKPNVYIKSGSLTVGEGVTLDVDTLHLHSYSLLLNDGTVRAQHYTVDYNSSQSAAYPSHWRFFTMPVTVPFSSLRLQGNTKWAVRRYSSLNRASSGVAHDWMKVQASDTLYAGQPYAMYYERKDNLYEQSIELLSFKLTAEADKMPTCYLSSTDVDVTLHAYPSANGYDAGWNFTSNPYLCYYDMRYSDRTSPIIRYDGVNYLAMSPLDDDIVLQPQECYFVQYDGKDKLHYDANGRMVTEDSDLLWYEARRQGKDTNERRLCDITLTLDSTHTDRTRIVTNPQASSAYEASRDAVKFFSDSQDMPQIFTLQTTDNRQQTTDNSIDDEEDGIAFAINERDSWDEPIALGIYAPEEGSYTLSIDLRGFADETITLIDTWENRQYELTPSQSVTLNMSGGTTTGRFYLMPGIMTTTAIAGVQAGSWCNGKIYKLNGQPADRHHRGIVVKEGKTYIQ